jgi:DNA-binding transcriptional MerR regulator
MSRTHTYSIGSLADAAGVSRRTVHFYVQRQLLPPPEGLGRGALYTDEHLARLLEIKAWQEEGIPLEAIHARLHRKRAASEPLPAKRDTWRAEVPEEPSHGGAYQAQARYFSPGHMWFRQPLFAGYELHVGGGRQPLSARQLASLASALSEILGTGGRER